MQREGLDAGTWEGTSWMLRHGKGGAGCWDMEREGLDVGEKADY